MKWFGGGLKAVKLDDRKTGLLHDIYHRDICHNPDIFGSDSITRAIISTLEKDFMLLKKLLLVLVLGLLGLGLTACGGDDSDTGSSDQSPSAQASSDAGTSSGTLEAYDPDVPSMAVEDNGVIHQEEIYKAWPQ